MRIHVTANHGFIDEIQTIAQVFFPHARFMAEAGDTPEWRIASYIEDDKISGEAYANGKLLGQYRLTTANQPAYLTDKRLAMLALYHALQKAVGAYTPWGALTGVRPTKMVREWMAEGLTEAEAIQGLRGIFCVQESRAELALDVAHAENRLAKIIWDDPSAGAPVGIYISIPFCPSRCVYCSFNTAHKPWSLEMQARYTQALIAECRGLPQKLREMGGRVSSIYIGGGTPTALADDLLERLLMVIVEIEPKHAKIEFTIEAGRPDTITPRNLRLMRDYGVNRISINPQTFNDRTLEIIGRKHTTQDFLRAYEAARTEGFTCINTDIIAGLPGEGPEDMRNTMKILAALKPENITIHTLAIKRASKLNEQRMEKAKHYSIPEANIIEEQLKIAHEGCKAQGLLPYYLYRQKNMAALFENTGYSRPGNECLYNIGMMSEVQTVLGVGAGAVSKYVEGNKITREFNPKNPEIYIERRISK